MTRCRWLPTFRWKAKPPSSWGHISEDRSQHHKTILHLEDTTAVNEPELQWMNNKILHHRYSIDNNLSAFHLSLVLPSVFFCSGFPDKRIIYISLAHLMTSWFPQTDNLLSAITSEYSEPTVHRPRVSPPSSSGLSHEPFHADDGRSFWRRAEWRQTEVGSAQRNLSGRCSQSVDNRMGSTQLVSRVQRQSASRSRHG